MKNDIIKVKKQLNRKHLLTFLLILLSVVVGVIIMIFGSGKSFFEDTKTFISTMITLFGLGLTSAIFVSETLDNFSTEDNIAEKARDLKNLLAKSLSLMALLILVSVCLEFVTTIEFITSVNWLVKATKALLYAVFTYTTILQVDITRCFVEILKLKPKKK